jgi:phage tail-like protein
MIAEPTARPRPGGPPPSARARSYLRSGLPAVYHERPEGSSQDAFALRFLEGLEGVLDPIVAMLDLLASHLDLDLAPPEVIELVGEWLGLDRDGALPIEAHTRLVRHATEIAAARGTVAGLRLMLTMALPEVAVQVRDSGGVTWGTSPAESADAGPPTLEVVCPPDLPASTLAAIRRIVLEVKPAHVAFAGLLEEEPA